MLMESDLALPSPFPLSSQLKELQEAETFCLQATRAAKDLARAETEIGLLQKLLKEKEAQVCYVHLFLFAVAPWLECSRQRCRRWMSIE